jgi:hypothetical protein
MDSIKGIDWKLLAQQKEHLCQIIYNQVKPDEEILNGLLNLIDNIQDEAEAQGQPVVFLTEDGDDNGSGY